MVDHHTSALSHVHSTLTRMVPRGCFSGFYIRIQIARIVIILTLPPRFFVKSRARFAILIGLVYSI